MSVRIITGDCREEMRKLIHQGVKVQCCVTSPPYWGLRQYLFDGAVILRRDLDEATRTRVESELASLSIEPHA